MTQNTERDAQYAATLDADATREKLAETYATALLGACDAKNVDVAEVLEEFDSYVTDVCDAFPKFEAVLATPMTPTDDKLRIIDEVASDASPIFKNFLKTLAKRGRMDALRDIKVQAKRLDDKRKGRVPVRITSAVPLDADALNTIAGNLRKAVGGEPQFFTEVDPQMIGGVIVRVGDVVYDASIATQLNKARQIMIDRSAHEIQSRRDCFRNPEGN